MNRFSLLSGLLACLLLAGCQKPVEVERDVQPERLCLHSIEKTVYTIYTAVGNDYMTVSNYTIDSATNCVHMGDSTYCGSYRIEEHHYSSCDKYQDDL